MELPRGMKDFEQKENADIEHVRHHFKTLSNLVWLFVYGSFSPIELLISIGD